MADWVGSASREGAGTFPRGTADGCAELVAARTFGCTWTGRVTKKPTRVPHNGALATLQGSGM